MTCTEKCRKPMNRQAHCSVCHKTFTGSTWFDLHRIGGKCREVAGLVERDGLWTTAEAHATREAWAVKLRQLRALRQEGGEVP